MVVWRVATDVGRLGEQPTARTAMTLRPGLRGVTTTCPGKLPPPRACENLVRFRDVARAGAEAAGRGARSRHRGGAAGVGVGGTFCSGALSHELADGISPDENPYATDEETRLLYLQNRRNITFTITQLIVVQVICKWE